VDGAPLIVDGVQLAVRRVGQVQRFDVVTGGDGDRARPDGDVSGDVLARVGAAGEPYCDRPAGGRGGRRRLFALGDLRRGVFGAVDRLDGGDLAVDPVGGGASVGLPGCGQSSVIATRVIAAAAICRARVRRRT
jgi:hypothetical protein